MSELLEDFRQYLPSYLFEGAQRALFEELEGFPDNIDSRLFTTRLEREANIFQGDGITDILITDLPSETIKKARVMIMSNTCDTDPANTSPTPSRLIYCPIVNFNAVERTIGTHSSASFLDSVRRQKVSTMFYLPLPHSLGGEGIALLDRTQNCDATVIKPEEIYSRRLFTLSDYGFYLFIFKLSVHFTRIREGVMRT